VTFEQKLSRALHPKRSAVRKRRKGGARRGPWRSEAKRRFVAGMLCFNCHKSGCQAAHLHTNGMSSKCSDELLLNFCPDCHDQYDGRAKLPNGQFGGHKAFEKYHGFKPGDLKEYALGLHSAWLATTGQLDEPEPECYCIPVAADEWDARYCAAHNQPREYAVYTGEANGDPCPF
jgi:hypothetical protein